VFDLFSKTFEFNIAPLRVSSGSCFIYSDVLDERNLGSRTSLESVPPGSIVHNVGEKSNRSGLFARSAGTACRVLQKTGKNVLLRLPSGKNVYVPSSYFATLGTVSNFQHKYVTPGKAGYVRLRGRRPIVRGIAMNPVDHPHGGRTNGGRPSVTP
jgi:large subunit ribosomal protein L2